VEIEGESRSVAVSIVKKGPAPPVRSVQSVQSVHGRGQ
jgi:hypothetical protein